MNKINRKLQAYTILQKSYFTYNTLLIKTRKFSDKDMKFREKYLNY